MSSIARRVERLSPVKRALFALETGERERLSTEGIAVLGMACRFPGGADNPHAFWELLRQGRDAVGEVPLDRWPVDEYYAEEPGVPGKMYTRWGGFLEAVDCFDAQFFGIAPREAESMDPQQRLALEVAWEALEHAGLAPDGLAQSKTGVFTGTGHDDYAEWLVGAVEAERRGDYYATGNLLSAIAGRIASTLGLQGPAIGLDTACSSSLVAVHLACQSLRCGESELALAGGVSLMLSPEPTVALCRTRALSPTGRCRTFDVGADGYVRGEGCGMVVLKRLSEAIRDGDPILAVILGSAVNHDGPSAGFTVPNGQAQQLVLRQALAHAGVDPAQVSYVEAHGTGTALGDPIETSALQAVLGKGRSPQQPLFLGSVKTNIGHLEGAAGIAGLIKVVLALQHEELPPHLHLTRLNPRISWEGMQIAIPTAPTPWPAVGGRRLAGVSAFGMSGTNAHVVLTQAPRRPPAEPSAPRPVELLCLAARRETDLRPMVQRWSAFLADSALPLADVAYTLSKGRSPFAHRLAVVADSGRQASQRLADWAESGRAEGVFAGRRERQAPRVGFVFTGQGSQYGGMGRQLYVSQPLFRQVVDECAAALEGELEKPLLAAIYPEEGTGSLLSKGCYAQPALLAVGCGLAAVWRSWGVEPAVVLGHSIGEYVAACAAGVMELGEAARLLARRGALMDCLPGNGGMAALFAGEEQARELVAGYESEVAVAVVNGPAYTVLSGWGAGWVAMLARLAASGLAYRPLRVSHGFHSPQMDGMLPAYEAVMSTATLRPPGIPVVSSVTGKVEKEALQEAAYWRRQVRSPVRYWTALQCLVEEGCRLVLEVGAQPTLRVMGEEALGQEVRWAGSLHRGRQDWEALLEGLGVLYTSGVPVDWEAFWQHRQAHKTSLPGYPFQRRRYWLQGERRPRGASGPVSGHPLLGRRLVSPLEVVQFAAQWRPDAPHLLQDHRIYETIVAPAAVHLAMGVLAATEGLAWQRCCLENWQFPTALTLEPQEARTVQLILRPEGTAHYQLEILSLAGRPENGGGQWTTHATGELRSNPSPPAAGSDLSTVQAVFTQPPIPGDAYYRRIWETGIQLGDTFRWIERLWRHADEALGELRLPRPEDRTADYWLYPGLLDSCFQVLAALLPEKAEGAAAWVPIGLERLRLHAPLAGKVWCRAWLDSRQVRTSETLTGHLQIFEADGRLVAELQGLHLKRAPREALLRSLGQDQSDWLYEIAWRSQELEAQPAEPCCWIIFADGRGVGLELERLANARGDSCVLILPQSPGEPAAAGRHYVDPACPEELSQVVQTAIDSHPAARYGVVYLWGVDEFPLEAMDAAAMEAVQARLCGGALALARALIEPASALAVRLWLVTCGVQPVGLEGACLPLGGPLWGLGRTIAREHPELGCGLVDLAPKNPAAGAPALFAQLGDRGNEDQVVLRPERRLVGRLVRVQRPGTEPPAGPLLRPDAAYLITGGLGALGLQVAGWMARRGARHLALVSRRAAAENVQAALEALRAQGVNLIILAADVSVEAELAGALAHLAATLPPLGGIVHAAGVLDDGVVRQQTWERFARVMAPKVSGAWNLHRLTRNQSLDFFAMFSSSASLLGAPGQANYAAANAFLDSLAHYRRGNDLPALSLNWGPWAERGMAARSGELSGRLRAGSGMGEITLQRGFEAFERALERQLTQVGVLPISWPQFVERFPREAAAPLLAEVMGETPRPGLSAAREQLLAQLAAAAPKERPQMLVAQVRRVTAGVLGLDISQPLDTDQPLNELGLDSLMAIELTRQLSELAAERLPATLIFSYPTVEALAQYLAEQLLPPIESGPPENAADPTATSPGAPDLGELSQEEVAALLEDELAAVDGILGGKSP